MYLVSAFHPKRTFGASSTIGASTNLQNAPRRDGKLSRCSALPQAAALRVALQHSQNCTALRTESFVIAARTPRPLQCAFTAVTPGLPGL